MSRAIPSADQDAYHATAAKAPRDGVGMARRQDDRALRRVASGGTESVYFSWRRGTAGWAEHLRVKSDLAGA